MGSRSFIESFVAKAFHEDLGMIFSLLVFANPQAVFAMFSLCYAQWLFVSYNVSISRYFTT